MRRDISLVCDRGLAPDAVEALIWERSDGRVRRVDLFDVYEGDSLPLGKVSLGFSLYLNVGEGSPRCEANRLVQDLVAELCRSLSVVPRGDGSRSPVQAGEL